MDKFTFTFNNIQWNSDTNLHFVGNTDVKMTLCHD